MAGEAREVAEALGREKPQVLYERFCRFASKLFGGLTKEAKLTEKTVDELERAGLRVRPSEYQAGFMLLVLAPSLLGLVAFVAFGFAFYMLLLGFSVSLILVLWFILYPASLVRVRESEAQAQALHTIMLLSFASHYRKDLPGAVAMAADKSTGKLAMDLKSGLRDLKQHKGYSTTGELLTDIAHRWGEVDEGTRRAIFDILRASGQRDEAARLVDLTKAPQRVLDSMEEQLSRRLGAIVMPTLSFLAFGSLAIVLTIGLSPIFGMVGAHFVDIKFFALVAGMLVVTFFVFTTYMSKRRPVTLPPPAISEDDPRLPRRGKVRFFGRYVPMWLPPVLVFVAIGWPGVLYLAGFTSGVVGAIALSFTTLWLVWAAAAAVGVYAYLYSSARMRLREEEKRIAKDWEIAFSTVGSRMLDGKPMGQAMDETARLMGDSPLSKQLKETSWTMDKMGVDLRSALFEHDQAKRVHNPLILSFLDIISRIRRGSEEAAGRACMLAGEFLATLHGLERRFRERIGDAVGNLWLVTVILLPLVCAMSVWVMEFMGGVGLTLRGQAAAAGVAGVPFMFGALETGELALLKLVMGLTTVVISVIIGSYIATIKAGSDRVELASTAYKTVLVSTVIFTLAYLGLGMLRGGV